MSEKFTLFWHGPFSQWLIAPMRIKGVWPNIMQKYTDAEGYTTFNCCEQYMMSRKAAQFGDTSSLSAIMAATHPRDQKHYGRKVTPFIKEEWDCIAEEVVFTGNLAKFTQHADLKEKLLATAGTTLVEASPKDPIWGIALDANDPRAQNRDQWLGLNKLGETLTRVREHILNEGL